MHPQDAIISTGDYSDTIPEGFNSSDISLMKMPASMKMSLEEDVYETSSNNGSHFSGEGDAENSESEAPTRSKVDSDHDKDSGIEFSGGDQDDTFDLPDKELVSKIINQVEFYFSNENILKDPFLLKHVRRNKEGYVSLKLIATFRKVKTFTKNWKVVAYSLKQSAKLRVNEQNTKVRRVEPLPEHDETVPSRTILIRNLPFEKPTMENVGELVSKYGEVALIRILRPGGGSPSSDMKELKKFLVKHPEVAESVYAVVEFEKREFAAKAMKDLSTRKELKGVEAYHLADKNADVVPAPKTNASSPPMSINNKQGSAEQQAKREVARNAAIKKRKNKKLSNCQAFQNRYNNGGDTTNPASSCSESDQYSPEVRRRSSGSVSSGYVSASSPRLSIGEYFAERRHTGPSSANRPNANSPSGNRRTSNPNPRPFRPSLSESESHSSPWVQRRLAHRESVGSISSLVTHSRTLVPEGVIRLPHGPDGTRGFATRSRAQTSP